ncbi:MAG: hypothetical protein IJA52_05940 [Clostridia bacterium]|nr:hypothetical protein [Clostridia bacterium]
MARTSKKGDKMGIAIFSKALDMLKSVADLCKKVIDAGDPEKYAKSVNDLSDGLSSTYDSMREIIMKSDKFSEEEKLQRLKELAAQEEETKRKCGEAIKDNRDNIAKIVIEVLKGFMTCGLSFAPGIIQKFREGNVDLENIVEVESPELAEETEAQIQE